VAHFELTPDAKADIEEIVAFIRRDSRDTSRRVRREIRAELKKLAEQPGMGHRRADANNESLRFWSIYSYLIIYRENSTPLKILRVIHGARDLGSIVRRIR
jgi:antitoxin ParD1/3/4/toxin ParE1/3/4